MLDGGGRVDVTFTAKGASGFTLLMYAAIYGHERLAATLLQRGALIDLQNSDGCTALMLAANHGHERVAELLLQHGAEINQQDNAGGTALMFAALWDHAPRRYSACCGRAQTRSCAR